jgi:hypothetical protein
VLKALKQKKGGVAEAKRLIRKEIKMKDNGYNTDGFVNVALVMKDAGGRDPFDEEATPDIAKLMTKADFVRLIEIFNKAIKSVTPSEMKDENVKYHIDSYKELLKFVKRKAAQVK